MPLSSRLAEESPETHTTTTQNTRSTCPRQNRIARLGPIHHKYQFGAPTSSQTSPWHNNKRVPSIYGNSPVHACWGSVDGVKYTQPSRASNEPNRVLYQCSTAVAPPLEHARSRLAENVRWTNKFLHQHPRNANHLRNKMQGKKKRQRAPSVVRAQYSLARRGL